MLIIFYLSTTYLAKWNKLKVHIFFFRYACMKTVHAYTHACAPTHTCTHARTQTHTHRIRIAFHCACISNWKKKKTYLHIWTLLATYVVYIYCQFLSNSVQKCLEPENSFTNSSYSMVVCITYNLTHNPMFMVVNC